MAQPIQGLTIGLGLETTGLQQGLKRAKAEIKAVSSEMAASMSAFDRSERSVEKYTTQLTGLERKLDAQKAATSAARVEYERIAAQHGENSTQAIRAATAYNREVAALNNLERHVDGVRRELQELEEEQRVANSTFGKLGAALSDAGGKLSKFGDGMKKTGGNLTKFVTTPILGIGTGMLLAASNTESSSVRIRNSLGLTADEAQRLTAISRDIYKDGFGESFEEVDTALLQTKQNMRDLNDADLGEITKKAIILSDTFDADVNEVTRAGNNLMQGFGIEAEHAFDLMAKGAQNGLNFSNEMFDNIAEYATLFGNMGYSAEEYFQLLSQGIEAGAYNLDYINDVMKEFQIRVKDGSKASTDAMAQLSDETNAVWESFLKGEGTVKDVANAVLAELEGMDDQVKANEIGVGLFGTKWEDLEADAMYALGGVDGGLKDVAGTMDTMAENLEQSMGQQWQATWREAKSALVPLGEVLLDVARDVLPSFSDGIKKVSDFFANMSPEAKKASIMIGGLAAAIGPVVLVAGQLIAGLGGLMTVLAPLSTAIAGAGGLSASLGIAGGAIMTFATGPIGIGIAALAALGTGAIIAGKKMSEDALEEVDIFGEGIEGVSDSTVKALDAFWELGEGIDDALMDMRVSGDVLTKEYAETIFGNFRTMNEQILTSMNENYEEQKRIILESFEGTRYMTDEEQKKILAQMDTHHAIQTEKQAQQMARIKEIEEKALAENRALTETELIEINGIRTEMENAAIETLSESAAEQAAIRQRLKDTAGEISANQAADLIQKAANVRDETIAAAEDEYDEKIATYTNMKDNLGTLTQEQYDTLVQKAKDQRDDTVAEAEGMYDDIYEDTIASNKELNGVIDKDTGEKLSKWDVYKNGVIQRFRETNENSLADFKRWGQNIKDWTDDVSSSAQKKWEGFKTSVVGFFRNMATDGSKYIGEVVAGAKEMPGKMARGISAAAGAATSAVVAMGNDMLRKFGAVVNTLIAGVNSITSKLGISANIPSWTVPTIPGGGSGGGGNARPVRAYHSGTDGHPGGPMIVGDRYGRELVQFPDGRMWMSPDTDTLVPDAPKGTRVIPNKLTEKLVKGEIPMYAKGIGIDLIRGIATGGAKAKSWLDNVWDYATNPKGLIDLMVRSLGLSITGLSGGMADLAKGAFSTVKDKSVEYVKNMFKRAEEESGAAGGNFGPPFRLTSRRGPRYNPVTGEYEIHQGDDWGAPAGTPIPSQSGGSVVFAGYHSLRGNYVRVKSGIYEHLYQHNSKNLVGVGQSVRPGQTIGLVGSTGRSTGPHLHYELKKNGVNINPSGMETGGLVTSEQIVRIGEKNREEMVIPLHRSRRTEAMKLLALAGKKLMAGDNGIVRPDDLPNVSTGGSNDNTLKSLLAATLEQNQILMQILQKEIGVNLNGRNVAEEIVDDISMLQHRKLKQNRRAVLGH